MNGGWGEGVSNVLILHFGGDYSVHFIIIHYTVHLRFVHFVHFISIHYTAYL